MKKGGTVGPGGTEVATQAVMASPLALSQSSPATLQDIPKGQTTQFNACVRPKPLTRTRALYAALMGPLTTNVTYKIPPGSIDSRPTEQDPVGRLFVWSEDPSYLPNRRPEVLATWAAPADFGYAADTGGHDHPATVHITGVRSYRTFSISSMSTIESQP